jgi:hypothetical protein
MARTFADLTPDERNAYIVWKQKLGDRTLAEAEYKHCQAQLDRLLHAGEFGEVYKSQARLDAIEKRLAALEDRLAKVEGPIPTYAVVPKSPFITTVPTEEQKAAFFDGLHGDPTVAAPADMFLDHEPEADTPHLAESQQLKEQPKFPIGQVVQTVENSLGLKQQLTGKIEGGQVTVSADVELSAEEQAEIACAAVTGENLPPDLAAKLAGVEGAEVSVSLAKPETDPEKPIEVSLDMGETLTLDAGADERIVGQTADVPQVTNYEGREIVQPKKRGRGRPKGAKDSKPRKRRTTKPSE